MERNPVYFACNLEQHHRILASRKCPELSGSPARTLTSVKATYAYIRYQAEKHFKRITLRITALGR